VVVFGISGNFAVSSGERTQNTKEALLSIGKQVRHLSSYIWGCGFGLLVFMKGSAALVWGPEDVIGVLFSTVEGDEQQSSVNLGIIFSVIGTGCMIGPMFINYVTDANRPITVQRACWLGLLLLTIGWLAISMASTFEGFLLGTLVRTMGSGIAWPYSTLLLQTLADKEVLGRILAVELSILTLTEAASATITGELSDAGLTKNMLALFGASLGFTMVLFWGAYHFLLRGGAAQSKFNSNVHQPSGPRAGLEQASTVELT
jgi:hypothetical protein